MGDADNNCYVDETYAAIVDSRCMNESPSKSKAGSWYKMKSSWQDGLCDDTYCAYRCKSNGVAFKSDFGPEYGVGTIVECIRGKPQITVPPTSSPTWAPTTETPTITPTLLSTNLLYEDADNNCYVDETHTAIVDSRCMNEGPSKSTAGSWYKMKSSWHDGLCNDTSCAYRCKSSGVAFNSDFGPEYGVGIIVECKRGKSQDIVSSTAISNSIIPTKSPTTAVTSAATTSCAIENNKSLFCGAKTGEELCCPGLVCHVHQYWKCVKEENKECAGPGALSQQCGSNWKKADLSCCSNLVCRDKTCA